MTPVADPENIQLTRFVTEQKQSSNTVYLTLDDIKANYHLNNMDAIYIPNLSNRTAMFFIYGAINGSLVQSSIGGNQTVSAATATMTGVSSSAPASASASTASSVTSAGLSGTTNPAATAIALGVAVKVAVPLKGGQTYAELLRSHPDWTLSTADLHHAYIERENAPDKRLPLDIYNIYYETNYDVNYPIQRNDTLVIPFLQNFVTVKGAVLAPGRFPYIPDRNWEYYINQAGGFDPTRNSYKMLTIKDVNGKKHSKDDPITPETTISADTNAFAYYFNMYGPIITTMLSIVISGLSVYLTTKNLRNN
jgi:hypothetical protein